MVSWEMSVPEVAERRTARELFGAGKASSDCNNSCPSHYCYCPHCSLFYPLHHHYVGKKTHSACTGVVLDTTKFRTTVILEQAMLEMNMIDLVVSTYRVFFLTGTPPKSSKYKKVYLVRSTAT